MLGVGRCIRAQPVRRVNAQHTLDPSLRASYPWPRCLYLGPGESAGADLSGVEHVDTAVAGTRDAEHATGSVSPDKQISPPAETGVDIGVELVQSLPNSATPEDTGLTQPGG